MSHPQRYERLPAGVSLGAMRAQAQAMRDRLFTFNALAVAARGNGPVGDQLARDAMRAADELRAQISALHGEIAKRRFLPRGWL